MQTFLSWFYFAVGRSRFLFSPVKPDSRDDDKSDFKYRQQKKSSSENFEFYGSRCILKKIYPIKANN